MMEIKLFTGTDLGCMTSVKDDTMSLDSATNFHHPRTLYPSPSIGPVSTYFTKLRS